MSLALRRIRRLLGTGSPATVARAARRSVELRHATRELERVLASDRPLVVGPFLGELGYELLYWRPYVLRLLRSHAVDPARVTVVGRGGSGGWYGAVAARHVDAFDLVPVEEVVARIEERVERTGQRKQVASDPLDAELARRAAPGVDFDIVHPSHMFWSARFAWEGLVAATEAVAGADHDALPLEEPPAEVLARLPERFVVLKAYFNECVPDTPASHAGYATLLAELAAAGPVVVLHPPLRADDHVDWEAPAGVVRIADLLRPETNLAVQAAVVARAEKLVATYGGFAYLGPYLGVPTVAVGEPAGENERHEDVLRAAWPAAAWERIALPSLADSRP